MATDKNTWILYQTTNAINGKIYVGVHKVADTYKSKNYVGSGDGLKAAIKVHGKDKFTRTTLAEFSCAEDAYTAEAEMVTQEFINRPDTYNTGLGGRGGCIQTPEIRAKLSAALKGKTVGDEARANMSIAQTGKTLSAETKALISANNLGKHSAPRSVETKEKMSKSHKGKVLSEATKAKISAANKTMYFSEEHRAKISAAKKGAVFTPEARANMSAAHKGKPLSEGHKASLRKAAKNRPLSTRCRGANHSNSLAVVIKGKYYDSVTMAANAENTLHGTVYSRVKNTHLKWSDWRRATEEEKLTKNALITQAT
jgi:hypothetical protein